MEGYLPSGEGEVYISDNCIYVKSCKVSDLKKYFCNEIAVYSDDNKLADEELIKDNCLACWIDENKNERDFMTIYLKE